LIRRYPEPWRDRYEDEMLALLDEAPARVSDLGDLAAGLIVERARALFEPGDRPQLTFFVVTFGRIALGLGLLLVPTTAGLALRYVFGALPAPFSMAGPIVLLACLWTLLARLTRIIFDASGRGEPLWTPPPPFSKRTGDIWLSAVFVGALLEAWGSASLLPFSLYLWPSLFLGRQQLPHWHRADDMGAAIRELHATGREMTWARMELERCQQLVSSGFAAPLTEAQDAIARITQRRKEAMATLHSMGYRARWRRYPLERAGE